MSDHPQLDVALKRLTAALDQCEAAVERLGSVGAEKRDLRDALAVMGDDRGRLAEELDASRTRTRALEIATGEVALRLGRAGGALRHLLAELD